MREMQFSSKRLEKMNKRNTLFHCLFPVKSLLVRVDFDFCIFFSFSGQLNKLCIYALLIFNHVGHKDTLEY